MAGPAGSAVATDIEAGILDQMIEIRRHLHRNPELSNRTMPGFVSMRRH